MSLVSQNWQHILYQKQRISSFKTNINWSITTSRTFDSKTVIIVIKTNVFYKRSVRLTQFKPIQSSSNNLNQITRKIVITSITLFKKFNWSTIKKLYDLQQPPEHFTTQIIHSKLMSTALWINDKVPFINMSNGKSVQVVYKYNLKSSSKSTSGS